MRAAIHHWGNDAESVVCDVSDLGGVRRAATEILALRLPIVGLLNNAGIHQMHSTTNAQGWDMTFVTNHLGPFALTEALVPHLPDGASVVFIASGVEDPERRPAKIAGFRGGRYLSAEASVRGEWKPGGSKMAGGDTYATSKQAISPQSWRRPARRRGCASTPSRRAFIPGTALSRQANVLLRVLLKYALQPLAPLVKYWSSPKRAARVIAEVVINPSGQTGIC